MGVAKLLAAVLFVCAHSAVAAQRRDARFEFAPVQPPGVLLQERASAGAAATGRLVAGGLLGGVVGFAVGGLAGAVIGNDDDDSDNGWIRALHGSVIGATIGESLGLAAGVHLGNRRQGDLLLGSAASLAIGALGAVLVWNYQDPPAAPVILTVTPIAQLLTVIAIER